MAKGRRGSKRRQRFSAVLAVKANARAQVGQPKASRVLVDKGPDRSAEKHKQTSADILGTNEE